MPVEVRKISMKTNITSGKKDEAKQNLVEPHQQREGISYREREAIIQDCIETMLQVLEERDKR